MVLFFGHCFFFAAVAFFQPACDQRCSNGRRKRVTKKEAQILSFCCFFFFVSIFFLSQLGFCLVFTGILLKLIYMFVLFLQFEVHYSISLYIYFIYFFIYFGFPRVFDIILVLSLALLHRLRSGSSSGGVEAICGCLAGGKERHQDTIRREEQRRSRRRREKKKDNQSHSTATDLSV